MPSLAKLAGQGLFYACAAVLTGYLSIAPTYEQTPKGLAQVKLSFAHGAPRVEDCRRLTTREIAALPPSERRPNDCARERNKVYVELIIDGNLVYSDELEPTGLSRDGPARTYRKFLLPAGAHSLRARLRDTKGSSGFDYEMEREVTLESGESLAIDFKTEAGGFILR